MHEEIEKIIKLLNLAERLKFELRHSWLSNGRRESVAEHTWRASLMAMLLSPYLQSPVDMEKTLKMIIIHDLVEAEAGDIPVFDAENPEMKKEKELREQAAIENIKKNLNNQTGNEIYDLWHEFEAKQTQESLFAHAVDKLEAQIQHLEADMETWIHQEKLRVFYKLDPYCAFDPALVAVKQRLQKEALEKMKALSIDVHALEREARSQAGLSDTHPRIPFLD